jgi:formylglycine-generating enzyme
VKRGAVLLLAFGCTAPSSAGSDAATASDASADAATDAPGPCPPNMSHVGTFCIDQYEGALEEQQGSSWIAASPYATVGTRIVRAVPAVGITPQAYISGSEAAGACAVSGKRLCTSTEWVSACRGPTNNVWPYGSTHIVGACNDAYSGHPAVTFFGTSTGLWDSSHLNDPGIDQQPNTVAKGGAFAQCVTPTGIFDLHGNLHEWVDDPAGTFRGGFYADGSLNGNGCTYATTAHAFGYHDYSTGFRCCTDAR